MDPEKYNSVNDDSSEVSKITLECLLNTEQYGKYLEDKTPQNKKIKRTDRKFYKKRIMELTRQLINNDKDLSVSSDVANYFERYLDLCVGFLKMTDRADIIQNDYIEELETNECILDDVNKNMYTQFQMIDADKRMINDTKIISTTNTLDGFVKVKTTTVKKQMATPVQKDINLKDPSLKNKGIRKKKNIPNKYDKDVQKNKKGETSSKKPEDSSTNKTSKTDDAQ